MEITFVCPCCDALLAIDAGIRSKRILRRSILTSTELPTTPVHDLHFNSDRHRQAAILLLEGKTAKEIAQALNYPNVQVVKNIISNVIYKKVKARNRAQFFARVRR